LNALADFRSPNKIPTDKRLSGGGTFPVIQKWAKAIYPGGRPTGAPPRFPKAPNFKIQRGAKNFPRKNTTAAGKKDWNGKPLGAACSVGLGRL